MRSQTLLQGMIAAALGLLASSASAYDKPSHMEVVELAWEVIRASADASFTTRLAATFNLSAQQTPVALNVVPTACTSGGSANPCGSNVSAAQWTAFINTMSASINRLGNLPADLPPVRPTNLCPVQPAANASQTLNQLMQPVANGYPGTASSGSDEAKCGVQPFFRHGGIFDSVRMPSGINEGNGFHGSVLGLESKRADDRVQDTSLRISVTNKSLAGFLNSGAVAGTGAAVVGPVICFVAWLFTGLDCGTVTALLSSSLTPVALLDGLTPFSHCDLPFVGDSQYLCDAQAEAFIGFWHFINMNSTAATVNNPKFDDRGGLYYPHTGPDGIPGAGDTVIATLLDTLGGTINYSKAEGPKNYQISAGNDGHPNTSPIRGKIDWEAENASMTMMEPLDNLAMYGWQRFLAPATRNATALIWPLHALGDATVPHHTSNTSGYGHTSYEAAVLQNYPALLFRTCLPERAASHADCPRSKEDLTPTRINAQFDQARRVLMHAYKWRSFITASRVSPRPANHVPVRDLVTALAQETRSASTFDTTVNILGDACGLTQDWGPAAVTSAVCPEGPVPHYSTSTMIPILRTNVERSAGAKAAFLMSAAELLSATAPPAPTCQARANSCTATLQSNGAVSTTCCENAAPAAAGASNWQKLERSSCIPTNFVANPGVGVAVPGTCVVNTCRECGGLVTMNPTGTCPANSTLQTLETRRVCVCDCLFPD